MTDRTVGITSCPNPDCTWWEWDYYGLDPTHCPHCGRRIDYMEPSVEHHYERYREDLLDLRIDLKHDVQTSLFPIVEDLTKTLGLSTLYWRMVPCEDDQLEITFSGKLPTGETLAVGTVDGLKFLVDMDTGKNEDNVCYVSFSQLHEIPAIINAFRENDESKFVDSDLFVPTWKGAV